MDDNYDNYGYNPRRGYNETTERDNSYSQPMWNYPDPSYGTPSYPAGPAQQNPPGNATTIQSPAPPSRRVYVPQPTVGGNDGDGMALASLIFGVLSASIGWIPVCGLVALFPAILGIVFGGLGFRSQRRRGLAIAGMILSVLAIAMAFIIFI